MKYQLYMALLGLVLTGCGVQAPTKSDTEPMELAAAMGGDTLGYARATGPQLFNMPSDLGAHPDFKTEWWYFTGNLFSDEGRRFGYELTLFRSALAPPDVDDESAGAPPDSAWDTRQLYMGHFSLADPETGEFYAFERFSRGSMGLAGAQSPPFRIWLDDWNMESESIEDLFPLRLMAEEDGIGIDLHLGRAKPMVLQGNDGWDPKGEGEGNASYYYSYTRIETEGTVSLRGDRIEVSGQSWKDHEWSTSALGPKESGWDWFALQLSDGREIMVYQLRRKDGSVSPFTSGTLVLEDGSKRALEADQFEITVRDTWLSPVSGAEYPSGWRLEIPSEDISLSVTPVQPNQELNVSVRYWEGAVDIGGSASGEAITGVGYVELTGYDTPPTDAQ